MNVKEKYDAVLHTGNAEECFQFYIKKIPDKQQKTNKFNYICNISYKLINYISNDYL